MRVCNQSTEDHNSVYIPALVSVAKPRLGPLVLPTHNAAEHPPENTTILLHRQHFGCTLDPGI